MNSMLRIGLIFLGVISILGHLTNASNATKSTPKRNRYGITSQCKCSFEKLPSNESCSAVKDNKCHYPDHEDLRISGECLPNIPKNHQVCFRTKVKECRQNNGAPSFHCRFFYNNFTLKSLNQSCQSSVELSSPPGSDYRTFCVYHVDLTSATNCTSIRLRHQIDHPESEYVDAFRNANPCNRDVNDTTCRDYVKVYYGENSENTRVWCRSELAELDNIRLNNATSFTAIYWTDSTWDETVAPANSFKLTAECDMI